MRSLGGVFFFLLAIVWGSAASADHMTGRYQGTGDIAGVTLDLRQTGTTLQGTISGSDQGTLEGQTDGGDNAQGVIRLAAPGSAPIQFQALWGQQGLAMRLQFASGTRDVLFVPAGAGPGPGPNPPGPGPNPPGPGPTPPGPGPNPPGPPPLPGPTDVQYFTAENNQPVGPLTLDQMIQRIRQGKTGPADLVWKTGAPDWARADSYPELAQAFAPPQPGPPPLPPGPDGPNPPPPPPDPGPAPGPGGDGKTPPSGGAPGGGDPDEPQAPPSNPGGGGSGGGGSGGGAGGGGLTPPSQ